jgi:hypothetical protein
MRPIYDEVLLFCPEVATGGPEALHQLGHVINQLGGNAKMAYYGPISRLGMDGDTLRNETASSPMRQVYAQYQPQILTETQLGAATLIVFPEVLTLSSNHNAAMWWLSAEGAEKSNPRLQDADYRKNFFSDKNLKHLYQSEYARDYLEKNRASNMHPMTDYTDPQFIEHSLIAANNPPISQRTNRICFFPNKGADLARDFLTHSGLRHQIDLVPIRNMSKVQVRDTLFGAKIYIDFGHHPGKDRVPREAAIAGAIVLLHAAGSANFYGDHPLSDAYRFTRDDITSGRLHQLVDAILDDPEMHFAAQLGYRQKILAEKETFEKEVRNFFFTKD